MRSEEVRRRLRWLVESQTAVREDCGESVSGGRCDYCQNPISVGEMECLITDQDGYRVVLDRACHAIWRQDRNSLGSP